MLFLSKLVMELLFIYFSLNEFFLSFIFVISVFVSILVFLDVDVNEFLLVFIFVKFEEVFVLYNDLELSINLE